MVHYLSLAILLLSITKDVSNLVTRSTSCKTLLNMAAEALSDTPNLWLIKVVLVSFILICKGDEADGPGL